MECRGSLPTLSQDQSQRYFCQLIEVLQLKKPVSVYCLSQVALESTVLHALTATGLETYTLRSGYYTVVEAERLDNRTNACPGGSDVPICLVGLRHEH